MASIQQQEPNQRLLVFYANANANTISSLCSWCFSLSRTREFHWGATTRHKCCLAEILGQQESTCSMPHCRYALWICSFATFVLISVCKFSLIGFLIKLKGINAIVGAHAIDLGILTTPQLHWMVRSKNKGIKASESDYFTQLIDSFRLFSSHCPTALASHKL